MSRRFAEVVYVGVQGRRPTAFRWRGNRYVVHEVLGHWRERRPWWTSESAGPGTAGEPSGEPSGGARGGTGESSPGALGEVPAPRRWSRELSEEYEVWRVEASRSCGGGLNTVTGVYDLCLDAGARPDIGVWRLLRVVD